nr:hypothetical protein 15 [Moraxellaceae bacterium]
MWLWLVVPLASIVGWEWFKGDGETSILKESKWWAFAVAGAAVAYFWFKARRGRA